MFLKPIFKLLSNVNNTNKFNIHGVAENILDKTQLPKLFGKLLKLSPTKSH